LPAQHLRLSPAKRPLLGRGRRHRARPEPVDPSPPRSRPPWRRLQAQSGRALVLAAPTHLRRRPPGLDYVEDRCRRRFPPEPIAIARGSDEMQPHVV